MFTWRAHKSECQCSLIFFFVREAKETVVMSFFFFVQTRRHKKKTLFFEDANGRQQCIVASDTRAHYCSTPQAVPRLLQGAAAPRARRARPRTPHRGRARLVAPAAARQHG